MKATLSILTFPQRWKNNQLTVRVLIIPRNLDPRADNQIAPGSPSWCKAKIALKARLISDPEKYPSISEPDQPFALPGISMPSNTRAIFEDIEKQLGGIKSTKKLEPAESYHRTRKYLPESYRQSFNFTSPRTSDAAIDDSYHCAVKDNTGVVPGFTSSVNSLSWGKVFAFCLRHPALAKSVGFVYEETFSVNPDLVKNGGWLYLDLDTNCSYFTAMKADQTLVKRYAAKIPKLKQNDERALFAAVQFPVLLDLPANLSDDNIPVQPSCFDDLMHETAQYDDGFCKIVHANQPVSGDLLREKEDKEMPVITEAGIRLGWDDEQLLIWMNRQMKQDETFLPQKRRTDAPMGVFQYRIDVRLHSNIEPNPDPWKPLCKVRNKGDIQLGTTKIALLNDETELGVEVYPAQLDGDNKKPFWLPQYFTNWVGKSLVLSDGDAFKIFRKGENTNPDKRAQNNNMYAASGFDGFQLKYGSKYDFRVRLADITGGGPDCGDDRIYDAPAPEGFCDFRRHVQPQTVRLNETLPTNDDYFTAKSITMKRPLLGYPAVLFTGKYPNAVDDLIKDAEEAIKQKREVGLPDPDVDSVEVLVEVKALGMDTLLRHDPDSRESWAKLYVTKRNFLPDLKSELKMDFDFVDAPVLNFTDSQDLSTLGLNSASINIDEISNIVLPTSRDIRITLRPVAEKKAEYYAKDSWLPRTGKPVVFITRRAGEDETGLFKPVSEVNAICGIWLQPDTDTFLRANIGEVFVENYQKGNTSSIIERLATTIDKNIDIEARGLSLIGKPGARVQFGISRFIRHSMSPDSTNVTFSTKSDLLNHWIVPVTLLLNRDWSWDGAAPVSFKIHRQKKSVGTGLPEADRFAIPWEKEELVGDIEMKQAINIQALYNPDRSQTYLCFIDAVEPFTKKFPEEMMVKYRIEACFKSVPDHPVVKKDKDQVFELHLPITTKPSQVPRIVSAGIAQSKYISDDAYRSTEPRKRFLWLEFDKPLENPGDFYGIRMLAYGPDPLLAKWEFDMFKAPEEPALPIDPEPIRMITPGHTDDKSGLNAMQQMIPATDSAVHYLAPLPPGLHMASAELFGFFTYEVRVGHKVGWCTAQGRYGRALRTTGVQHPVPQLFCTVNRNEKHIMVTAPFAQTVFNGADVTSVPPRTQLWALLYAQVKRADDQAYRNILLDDQLFLRQRTTSGKKGGIDINTDAVQYGITGWRNSDVREMLKQYGLPETSHLSVLAVEMFPTYDKFYSPERSVNRSKGAGSEDSIALNMIHPEEGMEIHHFRTMVTRKATDAAAIQQNLEDELQSRVEDEYITEAQKQEIIRPLTDQLGHERILRTSTLVPIPAICFK